MNLDHLDGEMHNLDDLAANLDGEIRGVRAAVEALAEAAVSEAALDEYVAGAAELAPPAWSEAPDGQPELRPRAAPAELPLGEAHRVRTTGSEPSCWAYVFGERPAAS